MTTVTITKSPAGDYKKILCVGHAGYEKKHSLKQKGSFDLVCASVSVLVINTLNALEELGKEKPEVVSDEKEGIIRCDFPEPLQEKSVFLLDAMVYGLENISRQYGKKYLQVNYEEV